MTIENFDKFVDKTLAKCSDAKAIFRLLGQSCSV